MDWLKLFTLLVAVASISVKADGPKKKIRIHLPQKVKHIHHHKKIYITNHPASSQYAPAYMPSAEGTVAVSTNVLPAMANIVPINSVDLYDESQPRLPSISPAASQLLPLYHARGYYGPTPSDIDESDYDTAPEPAEYVPSSYSSPSVGHPSGHPPKRVKIIKINEQPRKKVIRKVKPKRVVIRNKPQPPPPSDGEHPVSTFHEQFYSDIDGSGTIRKIRKPPRVEKIVDGDTEHIHTYSEEHIHKVILDDGPKIGGVVGVDHFNGVPGISTGQGIIPFKNSQTLIAIPSHSFGNFQSLGNTGHFEYAAYNPREVTHDHIFHDHGEISSDIDLNKDSFGLPPKVSYNSNGLRISGSQKRHKIKQSQKGKKFSKPTSNDFSYYESIYSPNSRPSKVQRPSLTVPSFEVSGEANFEDYRPIPDFGYKENKKPRNSVATYYGKSSNDYRLQQASAPAPFSVSSTVVHEYKPKRFPGSASAPSSLTKVRDPFANFKDSYGNNYEYDTFASSSNVYASEDKNDVAFSNQSKKGNKKSISTQNIRFGNQDHITYGDHLEDQSFVDDLDDGPTALENDDQFDQSQNSESVTTGPYTIKESSQAHQYYTMMAAKALQGEQISVPQASNDNFHYAAAPTPSTTEFASSATSPMPSSNVYNFQSTENPHTESPKYIPDLKSGNKNKDASHQPNYSNVLTEPRDRYMVKDIHTSGRDFRTRVIQSQESARSQDQGTSIVRGKLKYGDKI
ncbi:uncharacterized protein LOC124543348 [Vanessa cardui]|uniref:uncharacterized protein LOC124543348 n=1 Tax=Vanessa cardui TaxID=171605 RepID=UPI001F137908|nr:uncharacterized protein LOC124543348 [Vanessa cardui]